MLETLDDAAVHRWCGGGLAALRAHQREIDELNVYPVPDGDTGTNLVLTLTSAAEALREPAPADDTGTPLGRAMRRMARGALLGARGNSGVIVSQILRGMADTFATAVAVRGGELATALRRASEAAYAAVARPVEGTVLSVVAAAADAADRLKSDDPLAVARAAARAAREALARTPQQLPVLARAGVVDAGGRGLVVLLDALVEALAHRAETSPPADLLAASPLAAGTSVADIPAADHSAPVLTPAPSAAQPAPPSAGEPAQLSGAESASPAGAESGPPSGAESAPPSSAGSAAPSGAGSALPSGAGSPLPAGAESTLPFVAEPATPSPAEPGPATASVAHSAPAGPSPHHPAAGGDDASEVDGPGYGYEVQYLLDAEDEAVEVLRGRLDALGDSLVVVGTGEGAPPTWNVHVHVDDIGAAIEAGIEAGRPHRITVMRLDEVVGHHHHHRRADDAPSGANPAARGAVVVAAGDGLTALFTAEGATVVGRNPSTAEVLAAIGATGAGRVVLLPNDTNTHAVAVTAAREAAEAGVRVSVVPTRSPVQALAALAVRDPGRSFADDVIAMAEAAGACRYGEVCTAQRESLTVAGRCRPGDLLGLVEGEVHIIGDNLREVALRLVDRMLGGGGELVTVVLGADAPADLEPEVRAHVAQIWPFAELQLYSGGQPRYHLLVGVE